VLFLDGAMGPSDALAVPGASSGTGIAAKDECVHAPDEDLMRRYQRGDADAFRVLYARHREHLYRFSLRLTSDSAEGEEVFQETWMAVIRGREQFRSDSRFTTYLFSIARRRAADRWRKRGVVVVEPLAEIEQPILDEALIERYGPLDRTHNAQLGSALSDAIAKLPLAQREAFLMRAEGDLSLDEIARATQSNTETVKSRLRYATCRLRKYLVEWR
jgi:RNA polymerase sigma-70 factor (ECF subfamily)